DFFGNCCRNASTPLPPFMALVITQIVEHSLPSSHDGLANSCWNVWRCGPRDTHTRANKVCLQGTAWSAFAAAGVSVSYALHFTARAIGFRMWSSADARHGQRDPRVRPLARTLRRAWRREMRCWSLAMAAAIELTLQGMSLAADPRFPDWPCNQIKVPEISVAAVWAGPSIDDVGNAWEEDATIRDLVARLAAPARPSMTRRSSFQMSSRAANPNGRKRRN